MSAEPRSTQRTWRLPLLLAAATISGLISALLADGWGDLWSWCALGAPLVVALACINTRAPQP